MVRYACTMLLFLVAGPAAAAGPEELLQEGIYNYTTGKLELSVERLEQARALARRPALLGRIHLWLGVSRSVMGQKRAARGDFASALEHDPDLRLAAGKFRSDTIRLFEAVRGKLRGTLRVVGPDAKVILDGKEVGPTPYEAQIDIGTHQVEVRGADGERRLERRVTLRPGARVELEARPGPKAAALRVASRPPGAEVLVDGRAVGQTPLERPLPLGAHRLALRLEGYRVHEQDVRINEGGAEVSATLEPLVAATPPPLPAAQPRRRLWTWIATGGAVALAAVGVGFAVSADLDYDEYQTTQDPDRFRELEDAVPRKAAIGYSAIGVAGALAVTAVVLYFVEGRPAGERRGAVRLMHLAESGR